MSVTTETNRLAFVGDGVDNSPYAISFPLRDDDSVEVIYVTDSTGAEVVKTKTTDYTIAIADDSQSATLTLVTTAPASGETMVIRRNDPATRLSSYSNFDGQPAGTMNSDFDLGALADQTLQEQLDRAILVAKGHPNADLPLTPINMIGGAGKRLQVNAGETDWELSGGSAIDGSGTAGKIAKWSDSDTLTDSIITESGAAITVTGTLAVTSTLTVNSDADGTTILGRAKIGSGAGDTAVFSHFDRTATPAILQSATGPTILDCEASQGVIMKAGGVTVVTFVNTPATTFVGGVSGITTLAINGAFSGATTLSTSGLATLASVSVTANLDAATIGGGTPGTGALTTLSTSGLATLASAAVTANLDAATIGGGTPGTGAFTTLTASSNTTLSGNLAVNGGDITSTVANFDIRTSPAAGAATILIEANPLATDEASQIRFGRNSDVGTAAASMVWFACDGSSTQTAVLNMKTGALQLDSLAGSGSRTVVADAAGNMTAP